MLLYHSSFVRINPTMIVAGKWIPLHMERTNPHLRDLASRKMDISERGILFYSFHSAQLIVISKHVDGPWTLFMYFILQTTRERRAENFCELEWAIDTIARD